VNELPKSVRDELARQQHAGAHPDPDLLTAFAEGTDTAAERAKVEEHLATCGECREVMFLAAPEAESAPPVNAPADRTGKSWFRVWAPWAVAAVVLAVGTFTFVNKNTSSQLKSVAKNEGSPVPARPEANTAVNSSSADKSEVKNSPLAGSMNGSLASKNEALDASGKKDAKVKDRRDEERLAKKEAEKSAADSLAEADGAGSRSAAVPPPPPAANADTYAYNRSARSIPLKPGPAAPMQNQAAQNQQNQSSQNDAFKSSETVEVTSEAAAEVQPQAKTAGAATLATLGRSPSQWRISMDGNVERLLSGNWSTALARPGIKFTVVATIGPIIWAGGTRGALMRSVDSGASWQSIQLPKIGAAANSTITSIEFSDAFTGTVSTADHRSWSTRDRGETWRQP
jgi:hypothetical protein